MEFDVPWLEGNRVSLSRGSNGYVRVHHVMPRATREIVSIRNGRCSWEGSVFRSGSMTAATANLPMSDAERLCLSVMPSGSSTRRDFPAILADPLWQKVIDATSVMEVMDL